MRGRGTFRFDDFDLGGPVTPRRMRTSPDGSRKISERKLRMDLKAGTCPPGTPGERSTVWTEDDRETYWHRLAARGQPRKWTDRKTMDAGRRKANAVQAHRRALCQLVNRVPLGTAAVVTSAVIAALHRYGLELLPTSK